MSKSNEVETGRIIQSQKYGVLVQFNKYEYEEKPSVAKLVRNWEPVDHDLTRPIFHGEFTSRFSLDRWLSKNKRKFGAVMVATEREPIYCWAVDGIRYNFFVQWVNMLASGQVEEGPHSIAIDGSGDAISI